MKKKTIVIIALAVAILGTVIGVIINQSVNEWGFFGASKKINSDKTVAAVVNGDNIYKYQIDIQLASQKLSQDNLIQAGGDPSLVTIQTEDEILDSLIRNLVTLQEAKAQKLTADYNDAKEYQEKQFAQIKAANDEQSRFFEQYRKEMGWSEKEHLKQASLQWQDVMTMTNLYNKYFKDNPNASQEDYDGYIDSLVKSAKIEYK